MRRLICVYVVRIWQNDNRSFCTQVISHPSHFVPFWLFRTHFYFQFSHFVPSLVTSGTRFVSTFTWIRAVSTTIPFAPESFRPLSLSPWVVSPPNRFVFFSVRPCVVSPTFPFASWVDSPPYKFLFRAFNWSKACFVWDFKLLTMSNEQCFWCIYTFSILASIKEK